MGGGCGCGFFLLMYSCRQDRTEMTSVSFCEYASESEYFSNTSTLPVDFMNE